MSNINIKDLHRYIFKIANQVAKGAVENSVLTGYITEVSAGYYKITRAESTTLSTAVSLQDNIAYKVGDHVYLLKAIEKSGDIQEEEYFIFGLVSSVKQKFLSLSDAERAILDEAAIVSLPEAFSITSRTLQERKIITLTKERLEDRTLINSLLHNKGLSLQANFSSRGFTELSNFGLKLLFYKTIETTTVGGVSTTVRESTPILTKIWNQQEFIGQPYKLINSKQTITWDFSKEKNFVFDEIDVILFSETNLFELVSIENLILQSCSVLSTWADFDVSIKTLQGKDYFKKTVDLFENEDDSITLQATAKYKAQELEDEIIKYYWFIKDESVSDPTKAGYNALGGVGWRCLNGYDIVTVIEDSNLTSLKWIWKADDNTFTLTKSIAEDYCIQYQNQVKCVATYLFVETESNLLTIYNFEHEDFEAAVSESGSGSPLISENDYISYKVSIETKNETIKVPDDLTYQWYFKLYDVDEKEILINIDRTEDGWYYRTQDKFNIITIKDNGNTTDEKENTDRSIFEVPTGAVKVEFKCVIKANNTEIATTNILTVESKVPVIAKLKSITRYKYLISKDKTLTFTEVQQTNDSLSYMDWIYDNNELLSVDRFYDENALNWLKSDAPFIGAATSVDPLDTYYLYISSQEVWIEIKDNISQVVKYEDWNVPKIFRQVLKYPDGSIADQKTTSDIEQLNTFRELTNNGQAQGIFYAETADYVRTADEVPQAGKKYYVLKYQYIPWVKYVTEETLSEYYKEVIENDIKKKEAISLNDLDSVDGIHYRFKELTFYYIQDPEKSSSYLQINAFDEWDPMADYWIYEGTSYEPIITSGSETTQPFDETKIYFTKQRINEYEQANVSEGFLTNEIYYEISNVKKGDLYINASYMKTGILDARIVDVQHLNASNIDTGSLRVGVEGNEKFYADINKEEVKIGGYIVNGSSLISKDEMVGMSSENTEYAFWAGAVKPTFISNLNVTEIKVFYAFSTDATDSTNFYNSWKPDNFVFAKAVSKDNSLYLYLKNEDPNVSEDGVDIQQYFQYDKRVFYEGSEYDCWQAIDNSNEEGWAVSYIYTNIITEGEGIQFSVSHDGKLYAKNGQFEGLIQSKTGNIAGWRIEEDALGCRLVEHVLDGWSVGMGASIDTTTLKTSTTVGPWIESSEFDPQQGLCFWAGGKWKNQEYWDSIGKTPDKGRVAISEAPLRVYSDGSLYASKANIAGSIDTQSGKIGDWVVGTLDSFPVGASVKGEWNDVTNNDVTIDLGNSFYKGFSSPLRNNTVIFSPNSFLISRRDNNTQKVCYFTWEDIGDILTSVYSLQTDILTFTDLQNRSDKEKWKYQISTKISGRGLKRIFIAPFTNGALTTADLQVSYYWEQSSDLLEYTYYIGIKYTGSLDRISVNIFAVPLASFPKDRE